MTPAERITALESLLARNQASAATPHPGRSAPQPMAAVQPRGPAPLPPAPTRVAAAPIPPAPAPRALIAPPLAPSRVPRIPRPGQPPRLAAAAAPPPPVVERVVPLDMEFEEEPTAIRASTTSR